MVTAIKQIGYDIGNRKSIEYGKAWGVVDLTFERYTKEERKEALALTMAHELGHMVSFVSTINIPTVISVRLWNFKESGF